MKEFLKTLKKHIGVDEFTFTTTCLVLVGLVVLYSVIYSILVIIDNIIM